MRAGTVLFPCYCGENYAAFVDAGNREAVLVLHGNGRQGLCPERSAGRCHWANANPGRYPGSLALKCGRFSTFESFTPPSVGGPLSQPHPLGRHLTTVRAATEFRLEISFYKYFGKREMESL
jgi:hypothetical protein